MADNDSPRITRRQFISRASTAIAVAGAASGSLAGSKEHDASQPDKPVGSAPGLRSVPAAGLLDLQTLRAFHIWDGHCHLTEFEGSTPGERMANILRFADRMGIERMCIFLGMEFTFHQGAEAMRRQNNDVMEALKYSHGRVFGYAFMDPYYVDACMDELNRCIRDGPLVGLKFEYDTPQLANSPQLDPIIARAGELQAVVLHHTCIKTTGNDLGESTPVELAELARRHPNTTIVCGHTGANWELGIPALRGLNNVYADLGGFNPAAGWAEMAVRELGAEHVMYGSDIGGRSFASQLAKVLAARIPASARPLIFGENLRRVLRPILTAKGVRV